MYSCCWRVRTLLVPSFVGDLAWNGDALGTVACECSHVHDGRWHRPGRWKRGGRYAPVIFRMASQHLCRGEVRPCSRATTYQHLRRCRNQCLEPYAYLCLRCPGAGETSVACGARNQELQIPPDDALSTIGSLALTAACLMYDLAAFMNLKSGWVK